MAILHIFNPEHDIALASNLANFTAPHAGRQLRADLGFLPVLWAQEGDVVLVENVEHAQKASRRLRRCAGVQFASVPPQEIDGIQVWGWDKALKAQLKKLQNELTQLTAQYRAMSEAEKQSASG